MENLNEKMFDHKGEEINNLDHVLNTLLEQGGVFDEIDRILQKNNSEEVESVKNISIPNAEKDLKAISVNISDDQKDKYDEAINRLNKIKETI